MRAGSEEVKTPSNGRSHTCCLAPSRSPPAGIVVKKESKLLIALGLRKR
jgi:hypothetical protein